MGWPGGKGDKRRPAAVPEPEVGRRWAETFGGASPGRRSGVTEGKGHVIISTDRVTFERRVRPSETFGDAVARCLAVGEGRAGREKTHRSPIAGACACACHSLLGVGDGGKARAGRDAVTVRQGETVGGQRFLGDCASSRGGGKERAVSE